MQTTTIYIIGFSKETFHLDGSFEYPEEIQMIFFSKFPNAGAVLINMRVGSNRKRSKQSTNADKNCNKQCLRLPIGRQMTIEKTVSIDF